MSKHYCSCDGGLEDDEENLCVMEDPNYNRNDCVYSTNNHNYKACPDYKLRIKQKPEVDEQKR